MSQQQRYCRGVGAIVYVVDSASDEQTLEVAKKELHELVSKASLSTIPLLVLGNKNDLPNARSAQELIDKLDLKLIIGREVSCYSISAKNSVNIDKTLQWLIKNAKKSEDTDKSN